MPRKIRWSFRSIKVLSFSWFCFDAGKGNESERGTTDSSVVLYISHSVGSDRLPRPGVFIRLNKLHPACLRPVTSQSRNLIRTGLTKGMLTAPQLSCAFQPHTLVTFPQGIYDFKIVEIDRAISCSSHSSLMKVVSNFRACSSQQMRFVHYDSHRLSEYGGW
jgi:hypothetical protein